ncbi:TPA: hypothetical protein DD449_01700 [Candidatus Berkelbacteria bacterium]|uniref:Uracil-DNA glycosylase-like domain-containing protein n=1 Tax=Berkelbacteria bacterium GW2011_GWE1_39_12 TaxID=1618337 RepID=A0A0G4B542_9BACT|nr:MAG: hypothetical protein UT28_C0001G0746 [Berkelbacteria bacterium GW2011_GWE1_39_12]HBO60382.1 hypothetical protein [Candidatus Berkelbacteria bacterium]
MIKYHYQNSNIVFVGINPHFGSFNRGVPFSNNKTFWYLLARAGVINEKIKDFSEDSKLKEIYDKKFNQVYHLGIVNMIDRPSRDIADLKKGEELLGKKRLLSIVKTVKPKVVCFVGRLTYEKFSGLKDFAFGWQKDIDHTALYVMHFPLHGKADIRVEELKAVKNFAETNKKTPQG